MNEINAQISNKRYRIALTSYFPLGGGIPGGRIDLNGLTQTQMENNNLFPYFGILQAGQLVPEMELPGWKDGTTFNLQ